MDARQTLIKYGELQKKAEALAIEIDKMTALKKETEWEMGELKEDIKTQMMQSGKKRLYIAGWKINLSKSTSTVIEAEDELPEEFWRIEKKPDLMKVKEAIQAGFTVGGAKLVEKHNVSLRRPEEEPADFLT